MDSQELYFIIHLFNIDYGAASYRHLYLRSFRADHLCRVCFAMVELGADNSYEGINTQ